MNFNLCALAISRFGPQEDIPPLLSPAHLLTTIRPLPEYQFKSIFMRLLTAAKNTVTEHDIVIEDRPASGLYIERCHCQMDLNQCVLEWFMDPGSGPIRFAPIIRGPSSALLWDIPCFQERMVVNLLGTRPR